MSADPVPTCDICGRPEDQDPYNGRQYDWNGETGNHLTCESLPPGATIDTDLDSIADELTTEYAAAVERERDRAQELANLARGYTHGLNVRRWIDRDRPRLTGPSADGRLAVATIAPYRGSWPTAEPAQAHGRYMVGRMVAARHADEIDARHSERYHRHDPRRNGCCDELDAEYPEPVDRRGPFHPIQP